jgi:hypothetical protein
MDARQVMVLVTGAACNRIQSLPIRSAPDLHGVQMAVVSLTWKISGRMAIHAAGVAQYGNDRFKGSSGAIVRRWLLDGGGLRSGIERHQENGEDKWGASHIHAMP